MRRYAAPRPAPTPSHSVGRLHPSPRYLPDASDKRASRGHGVGGKRKQCLGIVLAASRARRPHARRRWRRARRARPAPPEASRAPPDRRSPAARRTAPPCVAATRATAPLSRSAAVAPVRWWRLRFSAALDMTVSAPSTTSSVTPPSIRDRSASVAWRSSPAMTAVGTMRAPGRSPGYSPPARPRLISAEAPSAMSKSAADCAPSVVPPPMATGKPSRRAMRASAARPTTTAARVFQSLRAERSNLHPIMHCDGDCRAAALLAMTGKRPIAPLCDSYQTATNRWFRGPWLFMSPRLSEWAKVTMRVPGRSRHRTRQPVAACGPFIAGGMHRVSGPAVWRSGLD